MSRIRANQITNQSADGAPTVQNGLVISGVTTSTTFSGSGASLTSLPAANLTGTLPAISGANLTSLPSQLTLSNNADNRVITGGSGVNLNGEANLTFDGTNLTSTVSGNSGIVVAASGNNAPQIKGQANRSAQNNTLLSVHGVWNGTDVTMIDLQAGPDTSNKDDGQIGFYTRPSGSSMVQRLHINSRGSVGINTISADDPNNPGLHIHGSASDNCRISFTTPTKSNPGSRIGYYGLSNRFGLDVYYGLEVRDVAASYATRFKIDNNGYMTNNQPYGHLRFNVKNDTGGLVIQTDVNTADVQNGVSHNGSGRLTVPVSGKYMIMLACNLYDDAPMQFRMMKNGSDLPGGYYQQNDSSSYWKSGMRSIIVPLSANDYIESRIQGKQDSQVWNHLTVYMLG